MGEQKLHNIDEVEVWRDIPTRPGYQASSFGHIRATGGQPLPVSLDVQGYPRVYLPAPVRATLHVHALVLEAFHGPRPGDPRRVHGCHNDGDPLNSRADNLRWDTVEANRADAKKHGTFKPGFLPGVSHNLGVDHPRAVFTDDDIRAIRRSKESGAVLAKKHRVSKATITLIRQRKRWGHVKDEP